MDHTVVYVGTYCACIRARSVSIKVDTLKETCKPKLSKKEQGRTDSTLAVDGSGSSLAAQQDGQRRECR